MQTGRYDVGSFRADLPAADRAVTGPFQGESIAMQRRNERGSVKTILILILAVAALVAGYGAFFAGGAPQITIEPELPGIGKATPVEIQVQAPSRGLGTVRVELQQGERTETLAERVHTPAGPFDFGKERNREDTVLLTVGRDSQDWLQEGEATIRVSADRAPAWLLRPGPIVLERTLEVKLRPPTVDVLSSDHYVTQGGTGVVVYRVGADSVRDGVRNGPMFFPGAPLPGGDARDRFAMFAAHHNDKVGDGIRVVAFDELNNEASRRFIDGYNEVQTRRSLLRISDEFVESKVVPLLEQVPDMDPGESNLDRFLAVNQRMRQNNAETIRGLAAQTAQSFLWEGTFLRMRNAVRTANYNDRRAYVFNARRVDQQTHLGLDLASTQNAPVEASAHGAVLFADWLGIYGNCVVVDHGYGLQSLYAHLSRIDVNVGDNVERGAQLGLTGVTGLAGGDHLHFGIYVHGAPVNPTEWFDGNWIQNRIRAILGDALKADDADA